MKFALQINTGPGQHQASDSALRFAAAALEKGHEIVRVFFYQDGVYNASRLSAPPRDEPQTVARWVDLAERHGLDLVVCVAAAQRRGILDATTARRHGKDMDNLHPRFRISGLGQLIEATLAADRLLVFGD